MFGIISITYAKGNVKVLDMLTQKDINKIRTMYYEQNYSVTEITRILQISRTTCYKYLQFMDFSDEISTSKSRSKVAAY